MKWRALVFHTQGLTPGTIADTLAEEGMIETKQGIAKFISTLSAWGPQKIQEFRKQPIIEIDANK